MTWEFNKDSPIYSQIVEKIETKIVSGEYKKGDKLLSIRDLATEAGVNPNTIQKAMAELERRGLIGTNRASGKFITEDEALIKATREQQAFKAAEELYNKLRNMGYARKEARELFDQVTEKVEKGE